MQIHLSIKIALPEDYEDFPDKEYTSVYLLDASYFFGETGSLDYLIERREGMAKIVQNRIQDEKIPPVILIGIGYTEEQRMELTTRDVVEFYEFFTDELIPQIESECRVGKSGKDRILYGYSASAHFSTFALMQDVYTGVETFNKFISISGVYESYRPAVKLEEKIFQELDQHAFSGKTLFIVVGASDPKQDLLRAHRAFTKKLRGREYVDLRLNSKEFSGKGHYDIPELAFEQGLIWAFDE